MTRADIAFELLTSAHDVASFTCAKPDLHNYLRKHALTNVRTGYAQTYVAIDSETRKVLGYFSLSATSMEVKSLPREETAGMPKYPVPGVLLAKMARDISLDGSDRRLGEALLLEAMRTALIGGDRIGWRYFVVDAYDEDAKRFYVKYDFKPLPESPMRLIMAAATVAKVVKLLDATP